MDHRKLENEIKHLEIVLRHAGQGPFPHAYWRARLMSIVAAGASAIYQSRLEKLENFLAAIESSGADSRSGESG